jgi:ADP-ribose pyrophosphatase YjhB (NUDIX family)
MTISHEQTESDFLESYDASKYEHPSITVDMVSFTVLDRPQANNRKLPEKDLCVLLVKRGGHPFKDRWALPGGFVKPTESLEQAAIRELAEETGVKNVYMEQLYTWSDLGRDPRTWVVSCSYMALIDASRIKLAAGDDAVDARWFRVSKKLKQEKRKLTRNGSIFKQKYSLLLSADDLTTETLLEKTVTKHGYRQTEEEQIRHPGELAFDHARMIGYAVDRLRNKIEYTDLAFSLMPEYFTLTQLQQVYETILDCELLKANFRRKLENKVVETDYFTEGDGYRPSRLFKVRRDCGGST